MGEERVWGGSVGEGVWRWKCGGGSVREEVKERE